MNILKIMIFQGKLSIDEGGQLCIKTKLSPQNPELYEIPIIELMEDEELIGSSVRLEIIPIKNEIKL